MQPAHAQDLAPYGTLNAPERATIGEGMVVHDGELIFTERGSDETEPYRLQRVPLDALETSPIGTQTAAVLTPLFGIAVYSPDTSEPVVLISGTGAAEAFEFSPGLQLKLDYGGPELTPASDGFLTFSRRAACLVRRLRWAPGECRGSGRSLSRVGECRRRNSHWSGGHF